MIKFGPNRYNSKDDAYDPPFERMVGENRFTMPPIQDSQSETSDQIDIVLDTSDQQKYVDGLVHGIKVFIKMIEKKRDPAHEEEDIIKRMNELSGLPLDDDIVRALETLYQSAQGKV